MKRIWRDEVYMVLNLENQNKGKFSGIDGRNVIFRGNYFLILESHERII
jgi:hypothetical protein